MLETLSGPTHPSLLQKRCEVCNIALNNQLMLGNDEKSPTWLLFCPNLTCPKFGLAIIAYEFEASEVPKIIDYTLISDVPPDTSTPND